MQNTKLLQLLKTLDKTEFRRLFQFIQSPYFNRNEAIVDLYQYLRKYYPLFESPNLEKEKVFQKLFPGQTFNLNKMRKLMSGLTKLVEAYLLTLEFQEDGYERKKWLADIYLQRSLMPFFQKSMQELTIELDDLPTRNRAYYQEIFHLNQQLFFLSPTARQTDGRQLLEQAMEGLDSFYLLAKLQLIAEMRTRENILAEQYEIRFLEEIVRTSRRSFASKNLLYLIYLNIIDLHENVNGTTAFSVALALFKKTISTIKRDEQQTILNHLLNHCIRLINQGETAYKKDLFELYKLRIEYDLLLENNQITDLTFSNIVSIGASMKAFDWTKNFIDKFAGYLKEDIREDIRALSLALLHFNKKDYEQAENALLGHNFSNLFNLLKSRCLIIRTYYEHFLIDDSYYIFLLDQCNAFEKSIRRNKKIAKSKKLAYLNFIRFTKKLAQQIMVQEENNDLAKELNDQKVILYKDWLLQKVEAD